MLALAIGLLLFLGVHSVRIVAGPWRERQILHFGESAWKGMHSLLSLVGLVLIVIGYVWARQQPLILWVPPVGMRHAAALLTLIAFILIAAAYVPRNAIRSRLRHPMIIGVKVWALAHLLANGALHDILLFGAFLLWAIVDFRSARRRQPAPVVAVSTMAGNVGTVVAGVAIWALFAFYLHELLIGVPPLG